MQSAEKSLELWELLWAGSFVTRTLAQMRKIFESSPALTHDIRGPIFQSVLKLTRSPLLTQASGIRNVSFQVGMTLSSKLKNI